MLGRFKQIDFGNEAKPKRLVFVCAGNICRSPLGEAVAKKMGMDAISIGLSTRGGDKADPRAMAIAEEFGYSLSEHLTTRAEDYSYKEGDLLVLMEPNHIAKIKSQIPGAKFTLLGLYSSKPKAYIHDPYNSSGKYFRKCEQDVMKSSITLANHAKS
jgi:protein-tyrosine-phosphatase